MYKMKKYVAAAGSRLSNEQAQTYGEHIDKLIEQHNGEITPEQVVEDAQNPESPLHEHFVWDDQHAAQLHRIAEARILLAHINAVIVTDGNENEVRAYHNVIVRHDTVSLRVYTPVLHTFSTPELADQIVQKARRELEAWTRRWEQYAQLSKELSIVKEALKQ